MSAPVSTELRNKYNVSIFLIEQQFYKFGKESLRLGIKYMDAIKYGVFYDAITYQMQH